MIHKAYDFSLNISKSEREHGSMMTSLLAKATSEMQRKSDIVAGKDEVLESIADKVIEEVIFEELDEYCEDVYCEVHCEWISKVRKRHMKILQKDSLK